MHITRRAPVLSATSKTDCICIIGLSLDASLQLDRSACAIAASIGARPGRSPCPSEHGEKVADYTDMPLIPQRKFRLLQTTLAFSMSFTTRQDLVVEIGRHSSISTRSPSLHSAASSCAWYFRKRVRNLP